MYACLYVYVLYIYTDIFLQASLVLCIASLTLICPQQQQQQQSRDPCGACLYRRDRGIVRERYAEKDTQMATPPLVPAFHFRTNLLFCAEHARSYF